MKSKLAVLIILASSAFAVACSPSTDTPASPTTTYRTTTTVSQSVLIDAYVSAMREYFPRASRSELISLGKTACDVLDEAGSVSMAFADIATDPSWRGMEESAGYTIGVAVPVFCPEYLPELKRLLK